MNAGHGKKDGNGRLFPELFCHGPVLPGQVLPRFGPDRHIDIRIPEKPAGTHEYMRS